MDERTRTDEQTAPGLRRTLPSAPVVKTKPRRTKLVVGLIVLIGLLTANRMNTMTGVFALFTAATNVTGFLFPII